MLDYEHGRATKKSFTIPLICMKTSILSALLALPLCLTPLLSQNHLSRDGAAPTLLNDIRAGQTPAFIENRGQWDNRARFLLQGAGYNCWVGSTGIVYDIYDIVRDNSGDHRRGTAVRMEFAGANTYTVAAGVGPREGYRNYLLGNDPSRWARNVREYEGVTISDLYEGVDLRLSVESGQPRYDLIVANGADPAQIALRYEGGSGIHVDSEGDLVITTAHGEMEHRHPIAYQTLGSVRVPVEARFVQGANGTVGFSVGTYDRSEPLVIDPVISSRVFAGGVRDGAYALAVNNDGRAYVCGWSYSILYPTTAGSYDTSLNNDSLGADVVVMKINTAMMGIEYSTFIGGAGRDVANGLTLDMATGELVVCGETESDDFPTSTNGFQRVHRGAGSSDAFVLRLAANGSSLQYGTFLGGTRNDKANKVMMDANGRIYVCGSTTSADFPVSATGFDTSYSSTAAPYYSDIFLSVLDPSSGTYSGTYLGGTSTDVAMDLALTADHNSIAVVGGTWSSNFPSTADALQAPRAPGAPASQDAFVTLFSPSLDALHYSTTLGGSQLDIANAISVAPSGSLLVTGETQSRNFPTTLPFDTFQVRVQAPDFFITEMDMAHRDPQGRPSVVTSVNGGFASEVAYDVMCGPNGERWVVGITASLDFPTTSDAYQRWHSDSASYDCFLMQFDSATHNPVYSTYLGGDDDDFAFAASMDQQGVLYVAGATASTDYPITTAPYSFNTPGKTGAFLTRFAKTAGVALPPTRSPGAEAAVAVAVRESNGRVELELASTDGRPHTVAAVLYDLEGRRVREITSGSTVAGASARFDCGELASGTYMIRMVVDRQQVLAHPVLVVR